MANVGKGPAGYPLTGRGTSSPTGATFLAIGTESGLTAHGVVIAEGSGAFAATSAGTSGQVLTSNGAGSDPSFQPVSASGAIVTINGDTGSVSGSTVTIYADNAAKVSGSTVSFVNLGTVSTLNLSDDNANTMLGANAGSASIASMGSGQNSALGQQAGTSLTSGAFNSFFGFSAGGLCTTAAENVGAGWSSLSRLLTGISNSCIGYQSGYNYTSSESNNICIGFQVEGTTSESNVTRIGNNSTAATYISGIVGVTASNPELVTINSSTGQLGIQGLTQYSVLLGGASNALNSVGPGAVNSVFQGNGASADPTFNLNISLDNSNAGLSQGVILWNSAVRMYAQTTLNNLFWGSGAGNGSISGADNICFGLNCGAALTSGSLNFGAGDNTLAALQGGGSNTAFGVNAMRTTTSSNDCVAVGVFAMKNATSGNNNTLVGYNSAVNLLTGHDNTFLGQGTGTSYTSSESGNILIGSGVTGTITESNITRIGTGQSACYISGIDGVNVGSVAVIVTEASNQLGTATLTPGTGITITPTANTITISASSSGFSWTDVTGATQIIAAENGYITDRGGGVVYTLPASGSLGDTFKIVGKLGLATITPLINQQLLIGSASGAVGITGTAVATNLGDSITFVCITSGASTVWRASSFVGNWTLN